MPSRSSSPPLGGIRGGACGIEVFAKINKPQSDPLIMKKILINPTRSGKTKQPVRCPFCSMRRFNAHGSYARYHPEHHELITIKRYLCKVKSCPVKTFSILPVPLLRIVRHTYRKLKLVYDLQKAGMNQASVSRAAGLSRGVIKRLFGLCPRFFLWLRHEQGIADWGLDFQASPCRAWASFIRDFSHAFYPARYGKSSTTENIHSINQLVMT